MNPENCPTCGQAWPERRGRICSVCDRPIRQHDRWHFVGSRVQHRDCEDTQLAKPAAAARKARESQTQLAPILP